MTDHFDALETRDCEAREAAQFAALRRNLDSIRMRAPGLAAHLGEAAQADDRAALARLPVLRKSALADLQNAHPPFGGQTTRPSGAFAHVFMSPGPIFEPGDDAKDWWRFGRALFAAGVRAGDLLHNCFAYHMTPAGMMFENGARALRASVFPGGVGQTEAQAQAIARLRPTAWSGTPDFLKIILDKGAELGLDLSSVRRALVSGGALFPSLRQEYADRGIACLQCYGTADLGLVAYESEAREGMIVDEGVIVEIVRPGTGDPVGEGEVGEVLVTTLNPDYPLVRFATGDLSAVLPGASPCGRTNMRIRGWMGRADQTTKIKGMFVRPEQVARIVARHPGIARARLIVTREGEQDAFELVVETATRDADFADAVRDSVASVLKLGGAVRLVARGALPNDGKVIDDQRDFG